MAFTLRDVLDSVASFVNQDPTLATSTDLTSQVNLINQSQDEWGEADQWDELRVHVAPSFVVSGASMALPTNFKKLMSPVYDVSSGTPVEYPEIDPSERFTKLSTDKYVYKQGNKASGMSLQINPVLASGASLNVYIQIYPSSMATLTDTATCPSKQFLVQRTVSKILGARSDPRFTIYKGESDDLLSNMIEEGAAFSGGQKNQTKDAWSSKNFRLGQD